MSSIDNKKVYDCTYATRIGKTAEVWVAVDGMGLDAGPWSSAGEKVIPQMHQ